MNITDEGDKLWEQFDSMQKIHFHEYVKKACKGLHKLTPKNKYLIAKEMYQLFKDKVDESELERYRPEKT